jgi:hypothetical protein
MPRAISRYASSRLSVQNRHILSLGFPVLIPCTSAKPHSTKIGDNRLIQPLLRWPWVPGYIDTKCLSKLLQASGELPGGHMKRLAISYLSHCNTPLGLSICMRCISTGLGSPFRTSAINNRTWTTSKIFYRESGTGAYLSRV